LRRNRAKIHRHRCCKPGYRGELCELLETLLLNSRDFFDKNDCLNSDGRRLLETIIRLLLDEHHEYKELVKRVRKHPCLENILRLSSVFYNCDAYLFYSIGRRSWYSIGNGDIMLG